MQDACQETVQLFQLPRYPAKRIALGRSSCTGFSFSASGLTSGRELNSCTDVISFSPSSHPLRADHSLRSTAGVFGLTIRLLNPDVPLASEETTDAVSTPAPRDSCVVCLSTLFDARGRLGSPDIDTVGSEGRLSIVDPSRGV